MNTTFTNTALPLVLALGAGALAVSVDLHNAEVQAAALVLVVGGFLLGAIWPRGAWRWALILGLSIVVGDTAAIRLHLVDHAAAPVNASALIALVPAFLGTYVGVAVRYMTGIATGTM